MSAVAGSMRHQRGLSLVEVMVGLTIGMILVAGLALMFGNASRSSNELERSVRHIENGRYAMEWLGQDLAMAGFYGTLPATAREAPASPCLTMAQLTAALVTMSGKATPTLPFPVQGLTSQEAQALPACLPNHRIGTPALVLRRLDPPAVAAAAATAGTLYLQASHYVPDNTDTYVASTSTASFTLRDRSANTNTVRRFLSRIYYIANCSDCSGTGDGIPTLTLSELTPTGFRITPIAEGIEQIGFDYGFDTAGNDGAPDEWYGLNADADGTHVAAAAAKNWTHVMAVRVSLVSRALEPSLGYSEARKYAAGLKGTALYEFQPAAAIQNFKRRAYAGTFRLQTPAGLREKP
ncbi:PilW family protein [Ramlibacter sp. AW1]|uniref:PilW family protein n=1 Tax=Ramlibacter aurantiacus TaxID=2801330 RepID=A0A936ZSH6_9BURK|nr:PilW family protein [Ramlibacter aurantiacus]MBL0422830.1 PilW family protein [Ramlibacter aurantiacus]